MELEVLISVIADADFLYASATRQDLHAKLAQLLTFLVPSKDPAADEDLPIDMPRRSRRRSVRSVAD